jgi:hypothetical protein
MRKNYRRRPTSRELNKVVNSFTVYKFIKALTTDFRDMNAYKMGIIDERGSYLKNPEKHISVFDRLVINLKVLLNMIPNPSIKAKLNYLTTGISLLAEDYGENPDDVKKELEEYIGETMLLKESQSQSPEEIEDLKSKLTGHMTHAADWSYNTYEDKKTKQKKIDPYLGIKHMQAMHDWFHGKETHGHSVDIKADGGVSAIWGKDKHGRLVAGYKNGKLFTEDELDKHDAPWVPDVKRLMHHAKSMNIKSGHIFQGDLLWAHQGQLKDKTAQPNTIPYKATKHDVGIAVHGHLIHNPDTNKWEKQQSVDHKQISHPNVYNPNLTLKAGSIKLNAHRAKAVASAISKAKKVFTPEVANYAASIHQDKHFSKFLQEFSNETVATGAKRDVKTMLRYLHSPLSDLKTSKGYMSKPTQAKLSEKSRTKLISHIEEHIKNNKHLISGLLKHHDHLATAKHHMLDQIAEHHGSHSLVPHEGHEHEGVVSNFHGETLAKLTREGLSGFSAKNRANSLIRFAPVHEDMSGGAMTASSGAVTGVTPGKPEDTIVRRRKKRIGYLRELWTRLNEEERKGSGTKTIFGLSVLNAHQRDVIAAAKQNGFTVERGTRHINIFHNNKLVGGLSKNPSASTTGNAAVLRAMHKIVTAGEAKVSSAENVKKQRKAKLERLTGVLSSRGPALGDAKKARIQKAIKRLQGLKESSVPPVGRGQPAGDNPNRSKDERKPSGKPPEPKKEPKDEFIPSKDLGFKAYKNPKKP